MLINMENMEMHYLNRAEFAVSVAVRQMRTSLWLPYPRAQSSSKKTTPGCESIGAVQLEILLAGEGAFLVEMV